MGSALWNDYLRDGSLGARVRRTLPFVVVYLAFSQLLISLMGHPSAPVRGLLNAAIDRLMLWASVLSLIWILYFVFDATRLCDHLIRLLFRPEGEASIEWPEALRHAASYEQGLDGAGLKSKSLAHLVTIRLVEARTKTVGNFIYYPSGVLLLMFLSRYRVFDNWDWQASLIIIYLISSSMIVYCALAMRYDAEQLRTHSLEQMHLELGQVRAGNPEEKVTEEQIKAMIKEMESASQGAFCRLSENPVVRGTHPLRGYRHTRYARPTQCVPLIQSTETAVESIFPDRHGFWGSGRR